MQKIKEWCEEQGVPGPRAAAVDQHRERRLGNVPQQAGFGMVLRPIAPGSAEWKSQLAQKEQMYAQDDPGAVETVRDEEEDEEEFMKFFNQLSTPEDPPTPPPSKSCVLS